MDFEAKSIDELLQENIVLHDAVGVLIDFVKQNNGETALNKWDEYRRLSENPKTIRLPKEDQQFFAETILNPPTPSPALVAAFRRRSELLNKVANGVEDMLEGRTIPIKTGEDFDGLCRDMGVDPTTLDEDGSDA